MADIRAHADLNLNYEQSFDPLGIQDVIKNWDRPQKTSTTDPYLDAGTYVDEKNLEAGVCVVAGFGKVRVEERCLDVEAKLPSASIGAGVSAKDLNAKAELASVAYNAGPVKAKAGLALDTGAEIGLTGVNAQILGTGVSLGRRMGISFFGSELSVRLW